jgi:outer membrane protein TolC
LKASLLKMAFVGIILCTISDAEERTVLSMADAVRVAVENHPSAQSAAAAVGASKGRFWRGISPPPPGLSLDYSYVPLGASLSGFGEKTLEINQSLEFPLTTIARGSGLSREVDARESEFASARLEVTAGAKLAYILALASERRLELAKENVAIAESFLREALTRKNVGEGTQLELLTAQVQRTQAVNLLETARTALFTARSELSAALGWSPEQPATVVTLSDSLVYTPLALSLDSLQLMARKMSPQVAAFAHRVGAAEAERSAAWMSVLPSLNFSYYRQTVGDNPNLYGIKFGISIPVWFFLDNQGQVQEASANVAIASEALRATQSAIALEVASSFTAYTNSKRQVELHQVELLPQAEEIFRVANVSYQAGEVGYVEFLQALQTLNAARNASLEALVDYNSALVRLEKSVGRPL